MTHPTNIRDPDIPVTLGAFRALQDEVRRLDAIQTDLVATLVLLAAQHSGNPASTSRSDCMAATAIATLRTLGLDVGVRHE